MAAVIGFGGMFLRADDPKALYQWYVKHLGLSEVQGAYAFPAPKHEEQVIFTLFKPDSAYFPSAQQAMINLQVDGLDELLNCLEAEGVEVDPDRQSYDFGRFGWIKDPAGNRIELWEPAATE